MARPKTIKLRNTLVKLFPRPALDALARETGAVVRRRKVDIADFVWNIVLGFGTGRERTIAGLRRSFEKVTGKPIEESSFHDRFTPGLVRLLKTLAADAFGKLDGVGRALTGPLSQFRDLVLTDSTVMRLHDLLEKAFPGCRTNHSKAALKMHVVLSVTGAGGGSLKVTDQRMHDGPVFRVGPWVRDRLLLFDLGYFRYQLFDCINRNGGYFISRLKRSANPVVVRSNILHRGRAADIEGRRLQDVLGGLDRQVLDVMVRVTFDRRRYAGRTSRGTQVLRLVGVRDAASGEHHLYLTNIGPERLSAEEVAQVYAARWLIELLFKELKNHYRIEDLPSGKREVVEALVYAAILTLVVSRTLLEALRRKLRGMRHRLPEQRWAVVFAAVAQDILMLMVRPPRETKLTERLVTDMALHEAIDPNANRPSLIRTVETRRHRYALRAA